MKYYILKVKTQSQTWYGVVLADGPHHANLMARSEIINCEAAVIGDGHDSKAEAIKQMSAFVLKDSKSKEQ